MSDLFKPIEKKTISSEIVEQILSLIRANTLKPGNRIPSERELSETFSVGRGSVREAMKILESTGLIQSSNKGKFVRQSTADDFGVFFLEMNQATIHDVLEVRRMIELQLAGLAAERATPEDIQEMSNALESVNDVNRLSAGDLGFHRALVKATHNSVASTIYNSVTGSIFKLFKHYPTLMNDKTKLKSTINSVLQEHREILSAVKSGDPSAARKAMKIHLDSSEQKILKAVEVKLKATR